MTRRRKLAYLAIANLVGLLVAALAIELAGRVFLLLRGSYHVLYLEPDRAVGWKQVPGLRWTWAGTGWYARDFSVDVQTNSHGFRDRERSLAKRAGTVRVALLGDSLVEAVQVPLEKTAGQLLERQMNAGSQDGTTYEVLNFGISNYGVGQYLLAWETYVRRFAPDRVFALVARFHMSRTVDRYEPGGFGSTGGRLLWIRPTFRLRDGALLREPAADFDEFVRVQERVVREELGGRRMRRRESSVIAHWAGALSAAGTRGADGPPAAMPPPAGPRTGRAQTEAINLAVLRELGAQVRGTGAVFGIVDVARYFDERDTALPATLARLCREEGFVYVPLGERLLRARWSGHPTRWPHDGHWNETGNQIFAEALAESMAPSAGERR